MHIISGRHIPRRTFLRGMGATVGLPLLDAMVPAGRLWASTAPVERPRLIAIEMVHGVAGCNELGAEKHMWSPAGIGGDFDLSPTALSPLEPFRDHLTIMSNTDARMAEAYAPNEIGGDHFRSSATFLTQAHAKQTEGSDVYAGTSMDQLYAQRFGQDTPLPSMQLCIENIDQAGGCAYGYACVYTDSISWASPTEPLPVIRDPRVAFETLFGAGSTPEERASRRRAMGSILDWIVGDMAKMKRVLGSSDRERVDHYLEDIREVERRIQRIEAQNQSGEAREIPEAPAGVPDSFEEHVRIMFDLQVLAFQSDMTRTFSFKLGRDGSSRTYPESGTDKPFHPASHHGGGEDGLQDFFLINRHHVSMVPYLLEKLKNAQEGDSNLLDKSLILYGSAMADGNVHNHRRCPLFLVGGASGQVEGGVHLVAPDGTPMANVMLSLLHKLGLDDLESFGDSTGAFSLSAPTGHTPIAAPAGA